MSPRSDNPIRDRALAALTGVAIGDALGMPTQMLAREQVAATFGRIDGFRAATPDHPLAHGLPAGSVTDDTEQAFLVGRLLVAGHGRIEPLVLAHALMEWEDDMRRRGSLDLLGPSTKAAVEALEHGTPVADAGARGTTNGAAMRIAPVGVAFPAGDLTRLTDAVEQMSLPTHHTSLAVAAASAIAAAVSAGVAGATSAEATSAAIETAALGATRGHWIAGADVASRIELAVSLADPKEPVASLDRLYRVIGTSLASQESIPAAFGILTVYPDDPWEACCAAASLGGDTDTIASMVGAVGGATHGAGCFPDAAVRQVTSVNGLDVESLADGLLHLRDAI